MENLAAKTLAAVFGAIQGETRAKVRAELLGHGIIAVESVPESAVAVVVDAAYSVGDILGSRGRRRHRHLSVPLINAAIGIKVRAHFSYATASMLPPNPRPLLQLQG